GSQNALAKKLISATLGSAGVRIAGMVVTFLVGVQLARYLGPVGYGIYGTVMALVLILAVPAQLGLPQLLTRELSAYAEAEHYSRMKGAMLVFAISIAVGCVVTVLIGYIAYHLWPQNKDASFQSSFYWGLVNIPLVALLNVAVSALRGFHRVIAAQVYDGLVRPALFAIFLVSTFFFSAHLDAALAIALQVLAGLLALLMSVIHLFRIVPKQVMEVRASRHDSEWVASSVPMAGTEVLRIYDGQYVVLLLGALASIEDVGIFRVALAAAVFVGLPSTIINVVVMPYVAQLHAAGQRHQMQMVATGSAVMMFFGSAVLTLIFFLFGERLLSLIFGEAFAPAWIPLALMSVAYTINGFFGSAPTILNMFG
ncbi:MAG: oligosaccharide flippase family protein, partial [Caldilineaceae bacterium]|nr:oligosaccharide flippase family protein [Caldilineaceae bacterium]